MIQIETGDLPGEAMLKHKFEVIADAVALRKIYPQVGERAVLKVQKKLDKHCIDFIARSPFLCIGSQSPTGYADVSPRGDPPGFVKVLDAETILIPDRPGNNRLDTFQNIFENPLVGIIFFIPGVDETLRVNGEARIVANDQVMKEFEVRRHVPKTGLMVTVREAFLHCAKALKRSQLWDEEAKIDRRSFTRAGDILSDHVKGGMSGDEVEAYLEAHYKTGLYGD